MKFAIHLLRPFTQAKVSNCTRDFWGQESYSQHSRTLLRSIRRLSARGLARAAFASALAAPLAASSASAADIWWNGGTANWATLSAWTTDAGAATPNPTVIPGASDTLTFNRTGVNTANIITLGAPRAGQSLTFNSTGTSLFRANASGTTTARILSIGTGGITINSGAGAVTIGDTPATFGAINTTLTGAQSWTNNSSNGFTFGGNVVNGSNLLTIAGSGASTLSGLISGTGGLLKDGSGTLILSNNGNSFSGGLTIRNGTVNVNASGNAVGTGAITMGGAGSTGATLIGNATIARALTVNAPTSGSVILAANTAGNSLNYSGNITLNGDLTARSFSGAAASTGNTTLSGTITGTGNLILNNTGAITAGSTSDIVVSNTVNHVGAIIVRGDNAGTSGPVVLPLNTISGNIGANVTTLTKEGIVGLVLSGTNAYSGGTTLAGGLTTAANNAAFGTGDINFNGTATGLLLNNGINIANNITLTSAAGVAGAGLIRVADGNTATISGTITINSTPTAGGHFGGLNAAGTGILNVTGAVNSATVNVTQRSGTVVLSGGGSYTGFDTNQGTTRLGANNGLSTSATVNLGTASTANLDLAGFNQTLSGITRVANTARIGNSSTTADSTLTTTGTSVYSGSILDVLGSGTRTTALTVNGGSLTLSGNNTYTGATTVNAGTLTLSGAGVINGTGGITVDGGSAKFLQNSTVAVTPTVTLTQGTVTGSGTINTVNVGAGTGGIISNNDSAAGATLTIGSLTFNGAATVNAFANGPAAPISTTNLSTNAAGLVTINASSAGWAIGANNLIGYSGTIGGAGFGQFTLGAVSGLIGRQTAVGLIDTGTAVALDVDGGIVVWSGASNGNWITDATNSPASGSANWATKVGTDATDFWVADIIEFNDTYDVGGGSVAVTQSAINISAANVNPSTILFNNSSVDYQLGSTGGFGIASGSLTKNGTGTLTITNANTYSGDTNINGGTLQIDNASALGSTGSVSFGGGTLKYGTGITTDLSNRFSTTAAQSYKIDTNGNNVNFASGLTSSGGTLTKDGAGTLTLAGANTYSGATTINGGTLEITGSVTNSSITNNSALIFNSASAQSYANVISGTGTLTRSGAGTLTLSGANTYTGATNVDGGTLVLGNSASLGGNTPGVNGTSEINMATGTTLRTSLAGGMTVHAPIKIASGASVTIGAPATALGTQAFNEFVINGVISGTGANVIFNNTNNINQIFTVTLNQKNTYGGNTTLQNTAGSNGQAFIKLGIDDALPTSTILDMQGGVGTGTGRAVELNLSGFNQTLAGLTNTSANLRVQRVVNSDVSTAATLTIDGASNTTFSGSLGGNTALFSVNAVAIPGSTNGNNFGLTKNGVGTFTLSGANSYSGATTISGGVLRIGNGGTTGSLSGTTSITNNANLTINRSNAFSQATDLGVGVAITGNGSFTQAGTGTTTLTATNTYTGATTISAGTLQIGSGSTTGSLVGTTSILNNGNLTINRSNAFSQATDLGAGVAITGSGSFTQAGSGTTTLTATNTYTGETKVVAGTLTVNGDNSAATGAVTVEVGGTLTGIGTIGGATTVLGQLNPGNSPGTLSFTDNLTLAGITNMEITGIGAGQYDILNGDGTNTLTFGGSLVLDNTGYFGNAVVGQTVTLFTNWQTFSGTFSSISGLDLGNGLNWDTSNLYSAGSLTVTAVPEPSSLVLFAITGIGGIIYRRSRKPKNAVVTA